MSRTRCGVPTSQQATREYSFVISAEMTLSFAARYCVSEVNAIAWMEREDCARRSLPTFCNQSTKQWLRIGTKLASAWPYTGSQDDAKTMRTTNSRSIHPQQRVSAMNLAPPNETRRPVGVRRWAARIAKILLPAGLFAISLLGVVVSPVQAAAAPVNANAQSKVARDLQVGIALGTTPAVNWARDIHGARYVQVIVVS